MGAGVDEELPDASTLGEPPPMDEVLDDLAMRFVINCPAEEQESFERLLFQVEAAFWFYEDQYREIWPHAFPTLTLLTFSQQLFSSCPMLKPFSKRTKEIYDAFTSYKRQIPTCGAMLLNASCTKLLLVRSWNGKAWGFPKGKIDKDEDKVACATREVLEEVGYDISANLVEAQYMETQWQQQTIRLYIVIGVPEDFQFVTRTKKEIGEIAWHKLKELPSSKDEQQKKDSKFWMVVPFVNKLRRFLAEQQKQGKAKKGAGGAAAQQQAPSAAPPPAADAQAGKASSKAVAAPLGVKAKKGKGAAGSAPAPSAAAPSGGMQVLQRNGKAQQTRSHPFLDFTFDRQSLIDALGA
jgi:mRNA-decapping enzyme subunit 2